jgi:hypothetical protein
MRLFPMDLNRNALLARDLAPPLQQVRAPVRQHLRLGHEPERVVLRATGRAKASEQQGTHSQREGQGRRQPTGCVCRIATACSSSVHCCRGACVTPQDAARRRRENRRGRRHRGGGGVGGAHTLRHDLRSSARRPRAGSGWEAQVRQVSVCGGDSARGRTPYGGGRRLRPPHRCPAFCAHALALCCVCIDGEQRKPRLAHCGCVLWRQSLCLARCCHVDA